MKYLMAVMALLLTCAFLFVPLESDASDQGLLLYEVNPYSPDEGFSLHNYGSTDVDLKDYSVTDNPLKSSNEGIVTFEESLIISPGETLTISKTPTDDLSFTGRHTTYTDGDSGISISSRFALADNGDDVYLFHNDTVVDVFCYRSVTADSSLWSGDPFYTMKGTFAIRIDPAGCDASCWQNTKAGYTDHYFDETLAMPATVTPFLFPESGGVPIYQALESASSSVKIGMYILSSANVYALLCDLEERGVDVTVLLEYSPLGDYKPTDDSGKLQALVDAGGEVLFIGGDDDRYVYHHAKYCIIDDEKVIITSENWTKDNMNGHISSDALNATGNRGWGAIIESASYAAFMDSVFENDADPTYGDILSYDQVVKNATASSLDYYSPDSSNFQSYQCTVNPLLSPDSSYAAVEYYIGNAEERIYIQEQSMDGNYLDIDADSPLSSVATKASSGTDARMILSTNNSESVINKINASFGIPCASMETPYVHNKGIICDDTVLVGSVNWTSNSFYSNRETMVAICSAQVSAYYAEAFLQDFTRNYTYSGLTVTFTEISDSYDSGEITVSVEVEQSGSFTYVWNLDGVEKTTSAARTVLNPGEGDHVLTVTVTDSDGNTGSAFTTFSVKSSGSGFDLDLSGLMDEFGVYLAPIALIILAVLVALIRMNGGRR